MACLYYENISFSPILGLLGPELPKWANGGPILVFMMLKPFSLISTQENRSNDMLHVYVIKHLLLTHFGTTQCPPPPPPPPPPTGISIVQMS